MGGGGEDALGAALEQGLGGLCDGAGGVDHVVDEEAGLALDVTDDLVHGDLVGGVGVAALVDDRQRAAQVVRPEVGEAHAPSVG